MLQSIQVTRYLPIVSDFYFYLRIKWNHQILVARSYRTVMMIVKECKKDLDRKLK